MFARFNNENNLRVYLTTPHKNYTIIYSKEIIQKLKHQLEANLSTPNYLKECISKCKYM